MSAPRPAPSLSTELLLRLGILAAAALLLGVAGIVLLVDVVDPERMASYVGTLVAADVAVFLVFAGYSLRGLVLRPLADAAAAAEAITRGDLRRRVPEAPTRELGNLARSVNSMTDRLLEERAQLVRAEKLASVGRLAAGIAHEVGNPLGAITGYVHVLRTRGGDRPELDEVVTGLEREAARIDRIVRGLLDYARQRSATPAPVRVDDVIQSVVELLRDQGVLRAITVECELGADAPVRGQRHDLEQLFVNLLLNAADAMNGRGSIAVHSSVRPRDEAARPSVRRQPVRGGDAIAHAPPPRAQMWLSDSSAARVLKVVVADSGPGVPAELRERIFDPFFTTKEPGKGTGLGLAIAARVVENFGGTIWVTGAREGGAAFHILLPVDGLSE